MFPGNFANFLCLDDVTMQEDGIPKQMKEAICDHLEKLTASFESFFKSEDNQDDNRWIHNPFFFDKDDDNLLKESTLS